MRAKTRTRPILALVLWLAVFPAAAQQYDDVKIQATRAGEGVYMLTGAGGNIGLSVGRDGALLVDDQFAPLSDKIRAAVTKIRDVPLRFVLNTHWHGDHTGGNETLGKAGAVIVSHENVRERMSVEQVSEFFDRTTPAAAREALPVVTFEDSVTFHFNDETIQVFHVPPAHTDGDAVVHFGKANTIHTGDLFFNGSYPFVDLESGGSVDGVIAAVGQVLALCNGETRIIPGHGPLGDSEALTGYRDMLVQVRGEIIDLIAAGKSHDEAVAAKPTAALDEAWGGGFIDGDTFVSIVYTSLTR